MNKVQLFQLVVIYLLLLIFSYALYLIFTAFGANDSVASALLSWAATSFATLAVLFTFNEWRNQKGVEVLANEAKELLIKLNHLQALSNTMSSNHWQRDYQSLKESLNKFTNLSSDLHQDIDLFLDLTRIRENNNIGDAILKSLKDENYDSYIRTWSSLKDIEMMDIELAIDTVYKRLSSYSNSNRSLKKHIGKYCIYKSI